MIGLYPFDSQIVFQGVEIAGKKAAMHTEHFHHHWFVLVTHDKHKITPQGASISNAALTVVLWFILYAYFCSIILKLRIEKNNCGISWISNFTSVNAFLLRTSKFSRRMWTLQLRNWCQHCSSTCRMIKLFVKNSDWLIRVKNFYYCFVLHFFLWHHEVHSACKHLNRALGRQEALNYQCEGAPCILQFRIKC